MYALPHLIKDIMIQFNNLEFLTSKKLRVNAEVLDLDYYANVYIDSIVIDTEDTVCPSGPSENPPIVFHPSGTQLKSIDQIIDVSDVVKVETKMLFVYVKCTGVPCPSTPCGMDGEYSMKPVVDYKEIYKEGLVRAGCVGSCGCIGAECEIDVAFANFALQYFRLTAALDNDDAGTAYDAWYNLMHKGGTKRLSANQTLKPCGCNG